MLKFLKCTISYLKSKIGADNYEKVMNLQMPESIELADTTILKLSKGWLVKLRDNAASLFSKPLEIQFIVKEV